MTVALRLGVLILINKHSGPLGTVAAALIIAFLPSTSPYNDTFGIIRKRFPISAFRRVDYVGAVLILAASVLLVFVLEEAGTRLAWNSATVIVCITLSAILWVTFPLWEYYAVDREDTLREPIFPIALFKSRFVAGMMLYAFFSGFPFMGVIINLPQRYQAVNNVSSFDAGIYMLPRLLCSPFASAACGYFTSSLKVPPFYLVVIGAILQVLGVGLMISLPSTPLQLQKQQFGFKTVMGIGFGIGLTTLLVMIQAFIDEQHKVIMIGAITQIRVLGGTIELALLSQILNKYVVVQLAEIVPPSIV